MKRRWRATWVVCVCALLWCGPASAQLTYSLTWGWANDNRQASANAALTNILNRFNAYGDFTAGNGTNVAAAYNPGVPTAQAGYGGWGGIIEYGGTWPNDRVTMHELNHWLGSGTWGHTYNGPRAVAIIEQFEGVGARVGTDGTHFWPYGLNYDNEWSDLAAQRNVALMYAARGDWGIGPTTNPAAWNATSVSLVASDPAGQSGFNRGGTWSDNTFAHPNADYSTGAHSIRTPQGYPGWTFAGKSLTVNAGGRLLYNSWGTDGTITIDNLIIDGGTVRHDQFPQDHFRLAGNVTLANNATFDAAQGNMTVTAGIGGTGSLTKIGGNTLSLASAASYQGDTMINGGTLRIGVTAPVAEYTFDSVSGTTINNTGTGGAAMNGTMTGGASITGRGGFSGGALSLSGGGSVDINSPITNLDNTGRWTVSAWVRTTTPGSSILTKGDGGWANGNTIFYLGDGTAGGSGGIPSGVRWAGGFFQGSTSATSVIDNVWHQVTYVNDGGAYAIYVDGVPQPLSPGNAGFGNADVGSIVRLGASTNTVAGDGAVNFYGLMDNVQFYSTALTADQVAAAHQGANLYGALPTTTNVTIASGATLDLNGAMQQIGSLAGATNSAVQLGSGQLIADSAADSQFAGVISGGGSFTKQGSGILTLTGANTYDGATTIAGGTLIVDGTTGFGAASVSSGGTLGGSGTVRGNLAMAAGSIFGVELSATANDLLTVGGSATLSGVLDVVLEPGFSAALGDAFTVLSASSLTHDLTLGGPAGSLFSLAASTSSELILTAVSGLAGDFNNDGTVNLGDYNLWRDNLGAAVGTLWNDPHAEAVGLAQYETWRINFGAQFSASALSQSAAVPEPQTAVLAGLVVCGCLAATWRRRF